jgi:hypothetical protein
MIVVTTDPTNNKMVATNNTISTHLSIRALLLNRSALFDAGDDHGDEEEDANDFLRFGGRRQLFLVAAAELWLLNGEQFPVWSPTMPACTAGELCLERARVFDVGVGGARDSGIRCSS